MSAVELVDDAARVRISRDGLDELLFVEAGAGTGKTKQLVDRVVALVLDRGVPMREIAAITFTEAAASELRSRVREAFERRRHAMASDDMQIPRCDAALAELDGAAIGTVHSFAQRILSEHPIEAGLPPSVEVLDEVESLLAFDARWEEQLDRMFVTPDLDPVIALARALGVRMSHDRQPSVRDVAVNFGDNWDRLASISETPAAIPALTRADALDAVAAVVGLLPLLESIPDDSLAIHVMTKAAEIAVVLDSLNRSTDRHVVRIVGGRSKWRHGNKGKAANFGGAEGKAAVLDVLGAADDALDALMQDAADGVLTVLAGEVARFTVRAADERRKDGRLEFHDLLVLARELLRTSTDARDALHRRYSRLLVDEFQDTDPIQIELAALIATAMTDPVAPGGDWTTIPVERERLFFVGDPKQSIYRFRRADIELFLAARDRFVDDAVRLTTNFRTVAPIIEWVNHVFGGLMTDEIPGRQPRYEPLAPHRPAGTVDHRVVTLGGPHAKEEKLKAGPLRELEAASVADAVAEILRTPDAWLVERDDAWHAARPEDITILVPTRTSLAMLMDALRDRGIEFRAETGTLVYETQELRDLVAILQAVAHGSDAVALVAALRSPILACGDDDLVTYRHAGGQWDLDARRPDLSSEHPVMAAMTFLDGLRAARWWLSPSRLLERIVAERRVFALALGSTRARDTWRRIRFLIDQARLFEASQSADLVGFVAWAKLQRSETARVHEPTLAESDDHAVRIMTIHSAKGLEFPITVLSGLTTRIQSRRSGVQIHWSGDDVELSTRKDVRTADFDRRADLEAEMDEEEKLRLLYVACTRARDHLLVSTHHIDGTKSFAQLAWAASQTAPETAWRARPETEMPIRLPRPEPSGESASIDLHALQVWRARRASLIAAGAISTTVSATELRRSADDAFVSPKPKPRPRERASDARDAGDGEGWRRGRAATAFGRAVHSVLQAVDLETGHDLDALATVAAGVEGLAEYHGEVAAAARSVLNTPVVQAAVSGVCFREMYVAAPVGDRVIEGYIDLLVRTDDGLVIVDYKTDRISDDTALDARVEEYRLQLAAYALAVEASVGLPVTAGVLVFAGPDGAVERRIPAAELGLDDVRVLLRAPD